MTAVTFDYGQTLAALDLEALARRVEERGASVDVAGLAAASDAAWAEYNAAKRGGAEGEAAWRRFMTVLLSRGSVRLAPGTTLDDLTLFLWTQQPGRNLWRRPIDGMFELCEHLVAAGTPVGIISNSEGKLAELVDELGYSHLFSTIADSGVLGIEKPDRRIFDWAAEQLGVPSSGIIHVGDAWEADVRGALAAGARAIWFTESPDPPPGDERIAIAKDAADVARALSAWRVPA